MIVVGIIAGWLAFNALVLVVLAVVTRNKPDRGPGVHEILDAARERASQSE